ncbi:MAG: respiratory nitrate reductase subunit gamma [Cyanobacteria bacterium TGS_CYA1]|nr:respiratory nitrate reductase subunit gamma [Cyanobacteria bacterium TGS_CYA1]
MTNTLLFIVLPYLAVFACVIGSIYRTRKEPMSYSSLSSQFLENHGLMWGSLPWHLGILLILLAHILAFVCPGFWQTLTSNQVLLLSIEAAGFGLSILCLVGLVILAIRRLTSPRIQAVTTPMDLFVIALLLAQVALGAAMAVHCKWGSAWCSGTTTPYLWSLLLFQPDLSTIEDLPLIAKSHIVCAWLFILIIPFSRLIHLFAVPLEYLFRPPQNVVWNNSRKLKEECSAFVAEDTRRHFLKAALGIGFGAFLLSVGTLNKVFNFFFGPRLSKKEETELMEVKLAHLESTVDQRKLELERQASNYIMVAALSELNQSSGKYFIDYQMQPAIAFKGKDGLPLLISAKCTHLGCTVGNKVDEQGRILCPCHVSYFNIETGQPNAEAPAKAPLGHLSWVIMDERGSILASRNLEGKTACSVNQQALANGKVYIAKSQEDKT